MYTRNNKGEVLHFIHLFEFMTPTNLLISEIFKSIQGEGVNLGAPSIFLRLGVCNLQCTWCDTPYTWKEGFTDYKEMSAAEVLKKIETLRKGTKIKNLVITGGEPLLQQAKLIPLLSKLNMDMEFETNGSMKLTADMLALVKKKDIRFTISPKLQDSGNKPYEVQPYPKAVFKFVYVSKKSEKLILDFLKTHPSDNKVYIMPEGTSVAAMEEKYKDLLAFCMKNGFNFTPRMHLYLFGNKRAT